MRPRHAKTRKSATLSNTCRKEHDPVHYLAVPGLDPSGEVVCVLSVLRTGRGAAPFAPDDEAVLTLVAQHAGLAIESSADLRELPQVGSKPRSSPAPR